MCAGFFVLCEAQTPLHYSQFFFRQQTLEKHGNQKK